ncbi:MAG: hypothetical protein K0R63_1632 [Rickettsiales bacterium]|jgi:prepilin-type N-terminal cleavage/methylation domain-containing protein|nr:hypothetical protein [Rickettsiales bacterium]
MQLRKTESGFSLVEAMVATAIIGIAFTGVFMLTAYSERVMRQAITREKLQMEANQFLDWIDADFANIDQYAVTWDDCTDPGAGATTIQARLYLWCQRLEGELGPMTDADTRRIAITTEADGTKLVFIQLTTNGGMTEIVMNRSYGRSAD